MFLLFSEGALAEEPAPSIRPETLPADDSDGELGVLKVATANALTL